MKNKCIMKTVYVCGLAVAAVVSVTGCRTSEANYRAAYEQAVAGREVRAGDAVDNTVYDKIRRDAVNSVRVVDGDSVGVRRERVRLAEPAGGESLHDAYVVVAQFKQLFNARSMCARLKADGYPGATLLVTREPLYYVAIDGGSSEAMMAECVRCAGNPPMVVKPPYPLVLQPVK